MSSLAQSSNSQWSTRGSIAIASPPTNNNISNGNGNSSNNSRPQSSISSNQNNNNSRFNANGNGNGNNNNTNIAYLNSNSTHSSPLPPPPPPLSLTLGRENQSVTVSQILATGRERTAAAQIAAHHPRIPSLVKLARESEMTWIQIGQFNLLFFFKFGCAFFFRSDGVQWHELMHYQNETTLQRYIGATAESLGDRSRALTSYESALRHNSCSILALTQVANIYRSREEFAKAAEYFGRVVGIAPESGDVWGALGQFYECSSFNTSFPIDEAITAAIDWSRSRSMSGVVLSLFELVRRPQKDCITDVG